MSKSKGNIIDPLILIDQYGADALRFTLAAMAAPGTDIKLSEKRVEGYRNFATKIWNASRFILMQEGEVDLSSLNLDTPPKPGNADEVYLLAKLNDAIRDYHQQVAAYRFDEMAQSLYEVIWHTFCDWHLEVVKPVLQGEDLEAKENSLRVLYYAIGNLLRLLHPLMPFITEELWSGLGFGATQGLLVTGRLPEAADLETLERMGIESSLADYVEAKRQLVHAARNLRSDYSLSPSVKAPFIIKPENRTFAALLKKDELSLRSLLRAERLEVDESFVPASATPGAVSRLGTVFMPLNDLVDVAQELEKLRGQLKETQGHLMNTRKKLSNKNFVERAPADVVQIQKDQLETLQQRAEKIEGMISTLSD